MNYLIDFDKLAVLAKGEDKEELDTFIEDNDLSMAIVLIDNEDELSLQFTVEEMTTITDFFGDSKQKFTDEDCAEVCWDSLEDHKEEYPKFTKALGKKIAKGDSEKPTKSSAKPKVVSNGSSVRTKDLLEMNFCKGPKTPRKGTSFEVFTLFLDDNLDEATYPELIKAFIDGYKPEDSKTKVDESLASRRLRKAFIGGYIEEGL